MAEYTCKDINGNDINKFVFGDDGVLYSLVNSELSQTSYDGITIPYTDEGDLVNVGSECCESMNFNFDSNTGKCYHRVIEPDSSDVKIVFNVDENNGVVFTNSETEDCSLKLGFDYLIEYDSKDIYDKSEGNNVVDILKALTLSVAIEIVELRDTSNGEIYQTNQTLRKIIEEEFYDSVSFNEPTGILLTGDYISIVNTKLQNELGGLYSDEITNSGWMHVELTINDSLLITQIIDEEVKFSIQVNDNVCDFAIIMDNIQLNKVCEKTTIERRTITDGPSFNVERVIDNKKAWVNYSTDRTHDLEVRETNYNVNDERLIINSKEMELSTSTSRAIEVDVVQYITENNTLLVGVGDGEPYMAIDLSEFITSDLTVMSDDEIIQVLYNELIDVKSRKVITSYPLLDLLYDRYLNSDDYGLATSNKYTYDVVDKFTNLLGNHWVELIEQVIPSTALWGSTKVISNNIFSDNKFKYKRYNLLYCNRDNEPSLISENNVEVIINTVDGTENFFDTCDNIYIKKLSDGCEYIGTVTIIGNN